MLLAEITWRPMIGDPDALGWTVTIAYLVASWWCFKAGRQEYARFNRGHSRGVPWLWYLLSAMMFALGVNKQLDLQILLTQIGREIAFSKNLYAYRRVIQAVFILCGAVIGAVGLIVAFFLIRGRWKQYGVAFIGLMLLVGFVLVRAASFYHVNKAIDRAGLAHWFYAGLELGGTLLVGYGAWKDSRRAI